MRILYHISDPNSTGAERWYYDGWKDAFVNMGYEFAAVTHFDNLKRKIVETRPDIFVTAYDFFDIARERGMLEWIRSQGVKIFMRMDWPREKEQVEVFRDYEVADIYFSEREQESMKDFEEQTGRKFFTMPNAANRFLHFPTTPAEKYDYDIVYLGAKLPKKKWFFDNVIFPLRKRYKVGVFGPYWTFKDNLMRVGYRLCRGMRFKAGVDFISDKRMFIPPDEENTLYSSAKISLNFHEREDDLSQPHYCLNQRTFKIPACGGFQLCDEIPALRKYFAEDEVVMASSDHEDWTEKIEYYLNHEEERRRIANNGARRALRDHTYHNRVRLLMEFYGSLQKGT